MTINDIQHIYFVHFLFVCFFPLKNSNTKVLYPSRFHGKNKDVHVCAIPEDPDDNELS